MTYLPVFILLGIAITISAAILIVTHVFGPRVKHPAKDTPFECGVQPSGDARIRFSVRFYQIAILFLLFDVESVFFFPFAVVYKKYLTINSFIVIEMVIFLALLLVGYFYVLGKDALDWE